MLTPGTHGMDIHDFPLSELDERDRSSASGLFDAPIKEAQWIHSSRQGVARSILPRPRCDYLAHAVRLQRTHLACSLLLLYFARLAVVTDFFPALYAVDVGAARLGDDLHGLIVQ